MDDVYFHNGKKEQFSGYATDIWFQLGREFVQKSKQEDKPLFLFLPVNPPHIPWLVPEKYREPYLDSGLDDESVNFYAMIYTVDEQLGRFIDYLKAEKVWEDTIFVFLTDNGSTLWHQEYNAGMRGKKGSEYEGGHRVPGFISWPKGNLQSPRDLDALIQVQDLFPTLMDLCGLSAPKDLSLEGLSVAELLRSGRQTTLNDRILIVQKSRHKYQAAILWRRWRLVNGDELHNMDQDPAQKENVCKTQTMKKPTTFTNDDLA